MFERILRWLAFAAALVLASWIPFKSTLSHAAAPSTAALGYDAARALLDRTSFGATPHDIEVFAALTRDQAVDRLLGWTAQPHVMPAPDGVDEFVSRRSLRALSDEERKAFVREEIRKGIALRGWWLNGMLTTPSPLTEKMTLFWHNHFTSSQQKVKSAALMYRQNLLLRQYALGNFADLLHAVAKDPAMLLYLDGAKSRKEQPNENFAREVMELFTLGEGYYTEQDIREAARAFTGWSIDPDSGEFLYRRFAHDTGIKTVLGKIGNFDGDDVLNILLAQPHTAEFIVEKMWREFVSPDPDPAEVKRIAGEFRDSRYEIKVALRALLMSDAFYAPQNRATLVKSPMDLIVGTLRQFQFDTGDPLPFVFTARQLGQDLFGPPNVKGWPGGEAWINSATLLARKQFLERLFRAQEMPSQAMQTATRSSADDAGLEGRQRFARAMLDIHFDADRWLAQFKPGDPRLVKTVLAMAPEEALPPNMEGVDLLRQMVLDPVYQLK